MHSRHVEIPSLVARARDGVSDRWIVEMHLCSTITHYANGEDTPRMCCVEKTSVKRTSFALSVMFVMREESQRKRHGGI